MFTQNALDVLSKDKMAVRKKHGGPDWKYYESPETAALFEPVKQYMLKNHKKVGPDPLVV